MGNLEESILIRCSKKKTFAPQPKKTRMIANTIDAISHYFLNTRNPKKRSNSKGSKWIRISSAKQIMTRNGILKKKRVNEKAKWQQRFWIVWYSRNGRTRRTRWDIRETGKTILRRLRSAPIFVFDQKLTQPFARGGRITWTFLVGAF